MLTVFPWQIVYRIQWKNRKALPREAYCPTAIEHIANILTHGLWIFPSVLATFELLNRSSNAPQLISAIVYGATLIFLFCISTSFHCVFYQNRKQ